MRDPKSIAHAVKVTPAAVFAFDLVALRGRDLRALPLLARKEMLLKDVLKDSTRIRYTQHVGEGGVRLYELAAELGIAARRLALPPRPHSVLGEDQDPRGARD
jgi:bifunctional non-homologous end joining protein LigD